MVKKYYRNPRAHAINLYITKRFNKIKLIEANE